MLWRGSRGSTTSLAGHHRGHGRPAGHQAKPRAPAARSRTGDRPAGVLRRAARRARGSAGGGPPLRHRPPGRARRRPRRRLQPRPAGRWGAHDHPPTTEKRRATPRQTCTRSTKRPGRQTRVAKLNRKPGRTELPGRRNWTRRAVRLNSQPSRTEPAGPRSCTARAEIPPPDETRCRPPTRAGKHR